MKPRRTLSVALVSEHTLDGRVAVRMWTVRLRRPPPPASAPGHVLRRARLGVTVTFALAGGLVGVFTARIPALIEKLSISAGQLGVVLFVWGLGAICATQALRFVMARIGSACVLRSAAPLYAVCVLLVGFAPSYELLLLEVGLFGVAFGAVEAAANAQGSAVERAYGRPLLNGMHAGWPVGAGIGGLCAAASAQLGVSHTGSLGGAAVLVLPLALAVGGTALDSPRGDARTGVGNRARLRPGVYLLGLVAFAAFALEGAVTDWSAVLLYDGLGSSHSVAALAYPLFQCGMLIGRLGADRLLARLGPRPLVICAGLVTTAGLIATATVQQPLAVLAGVNLVGMGVSPLVPVAVSLAAGTDPARRDAAIAQVGVVGCCGVLAGPLMIAGLAEMTTLRAALAVVAVLLGSVIVASGQLLHAGGYTTSPMRR